MPRQTPGQAQRADATRGEVAARAKAPHSRSLAGHSKEGPGEGGGEGRGTEPGCREPGGRGAGEGGRYTRVKALRAGALGSADRRRPRLRVPGWGGAYGREVAGCGDPTMRARRSRR